MGQIEKDGYTFDSGWIDSQINKLTDRTIPIVARRYALFREKGEHISAMKTIPEMMPNDPATMAHARAYLAALEKAWDELVYESRTR